MKASPEALILLDALLRLDPESLKLMCIRRSIIAWDVVAHDPVHLF